MSDIRKSKRVSFEFDEHSRASREEVEQEGRVMPNLADDPFEDIMCDRDGIGGKLPPEAEAKFQANMAALVHNFEYAETLEHLTNAQLADLLLNRVWAVLSITSDESAIVDEAISRLRGEDGQT